MDGDSCFEEKKGYDTFMKINPTLYVATSIAIIAVYFAVLLTFENTFNSIVEVWIPIILMLNAVIVSPIIIYRKTDVENRRDYIKDMATLSIVIFLVALGFLHLVWLIIPSASFDSGWGIIATWFMVTVGAIIYGAVVFLAKLADKALSPENKKISGFIFPILYVLLILFSILLFVLAILEFI